MLYRGHFGMIVVVDGSIGMMMVVMVVMVMRNGGCCVAG